MRTPLAGPRARPTRCSRSHLRPRGLTSTACRPARSRTRSRPATWSRPSARSPRSTASTSTSPPGSASACSAPTAPASRRRCGCSPARRSPTRASCGCSATSCPGEAKAARAEMGVVPQLDNLDVDVTVEDNLAVFARLYRVDDVPGAVDRALDLARLADRRRDAVDELSGGMRRRLLLARGLVHEPRAGPARRADRRARPADPDRALVADRRPAQRRRDDPDVHPLHRGGRAARRRGRGDGRRAGSSPAGAPTS